MTDRSAAAAGLLVLALLVSAVALPALATGKPANQIPVSDMPGQGDALSSPTAEAWESVERTEIPLASAPSGLPNADSIAVEAVNVRAARTDSAMYVRMRWADATENTSTGAPTEFADGAAMQIPVNATTQPDIALGSQNVPVNVWYWSADTGTEELLAGGQGTITEMSEPAVETETVHEDGTWTVVMTRSLAAEGENRAALDTGTDMDVAFAVWDGANAERSGHHAVSDWFTYPFGPTETGPAAQYVLWAVAGIVLAIALLLTVYAVRGTGGS